MTSFNFHRWFRSLATMRLYQMKHIAHTCYKCYLLSSVTISYNVNKCLVIYNDIQTWHWLINIPLLLLCYFSIKEIGLNFCLFHSPNRFIIEHSITMKRWDRQTKYARDVIAANIKRIWGKPRITIVSCNTKIWQFVHKTKSYVSWENDIQLHAIYIANLQVDMSNSHVKRLSKIQRVLFLSFYYQTKPYKKSFVFCNLVQSYILSYNLNKAIFNFTQDQFFLDKLTYSAGWIDVIGRLNKKDYSEYSILIKKKQQSVNFDTSKSCI